MKKVSRAPTTAQLARERFWQEKVQAVIDKNRKNNQPEKKTTDNVRQVKEGVQMASWKQQKTLVQTIAEGKLRGNTDTPELKYHKSRFRYHQDQADKVVTTVGGADYDKFAKENGEDLLRAYKAVHKLHKERAKFHLEEIQKLNKSTSKKKA